MDVLREAYALYAKDECCLPHSTFLRFGKGSSNRIIGLPAFVGGTFDVAGFKWVASFPNNRHSGFDRASATLTLNEVEHGRPIAFMEASSINAHRTAGSAALAAQILHTGNDPHRLALIGCGYIACELLNYLLAAFPSVESVHLLDLDGSRAAFLRHHLLSRHEGLDVSCVSSLKELASRRCAIICFATSATSPWVQDGDLFQAGTLVLHISLRDIAPGVLVACNNVVDVADHVCRENTSVHLAESATGGRGFINAELPFLIDESTSFVGDPQKATVFSPFGLGILDVALGHWIKKEADKSGGLQVFRDFFPQPWGT
jgi:2,3-diaminopropionate biosynthesis protein SbnB